MEIQPKLLRLLQEREYERFGENVARTAKRPRDRRHQSRFEKARGRRRVPRGLVFPAERDCGGNAALAHARRGFDALCRALCAIFRRAMRTADRGHFRGSRRLFGGLLVAGQLARVAKCHRARGDPGQGRPSFAGGFSRRTGRPKCRRGRKAMAVRHTSARSLPWTNWKRLICAGCWRVRPAWRKRRKSWALTRPPSIANGRKSGWPDPAIPSRGQILARRRHRQLAMLHALGGNQFIGDFADHRRLAPHQQHFQAIVMVQMHVHR